MKGRKRQMLVDTLGLPLRMRVYPANWADTDGGQRILKTLPLTPRLKEVRADQGYDSRALMM